ncbi:MAG: GDSL-type esterase/lipase family protein [Pseudomonadota bacterium]
MINHPPWYIEKHRNTLSMIKQNAGNIELVFIGDSIVSAWADKGVEAWNTYFSPYGALNLGFNGDCTEDVVWRIENRQLAGLSPTLVILKIGTNNTGHRRDEAEKTAAEIGYIIDLIRKVLPYSHVLLHALMPRGRKPTSPLRQVNNEVNERIKLFATRPNVSWVDVNDLFLDSEGVIRQSIMEDALHPNADQYLPWAKALAPHVSSIFNTCKK